MSVNQASPPAKSYRLRLFVAGSTLRSRRAIENLQRVCNEQLDGTYELEVIDVYQQPQLAVEYQVIAAPTLVKLLPLPIRRVIGDLSATDRVLHGLDVVPVPPASSHDA